METKQLAAIRIRGMVGTSQRVESTMSMLRLYRKNYCCVVDSNPVFMGMISKSKDFITWGEIDDETFKLLVDKRGDEFNGKESDSKGKLSYDDFVVINNKKIKKYFRLNPPRKGFGRKGIKQPFSNGGALGYRGEKINDLIKRMI